MRRIAYLRVSTDEQDPENQRRDVESVVDGDVEWVIEHGSAWKKEGLADRPQFKRIYDLVKRGRVERLYVWDIDRLFRKRKKLVAFLELCKACGCIVISYRQQFLRELERIPPPWNEIFYDFIIQVFAYLAEEESQKKSERVRAAFKSGRYNGRWGRPKAGFNKHRAYHLLFSEGCSVRRVAAELGVSFTTVWRFKKECEKNPPSFINESGCKLKD